MNNKEYTISKEQLAAIEKMLQIGKRVELIPLKDGVKLMEIQRKELKTE